MATAVGLAGHGHNVVATMRDTGRADALKEAAAEAGVPLHIVQLDVDDDTSVHTAFDQILDTHGTVDVLVNNAGISTMRPWEQQPISEIAAAFNTNLFGAVRCAQAVLPTMRS